MVCGLLNDVVSILGCVASSGNGGEWLIGRDKKGNGRGFIFDTFVSKD
jgi:hypothetical protein